MCPLCNHLKLPSYENNKLSITHIFAGNTLDRGDHARRDEIALKRMIRRDNTKLLPFHNLKPLVKRSPAPELAWINHEFLDDLPIEAGGPKFLGFDKDQNPYFAVDVSTVKDPSRIAIIADNAAFEDGRSAAIDIPPEQSGILAQARSNLNWHLQHRFCSFCGSESQSQRGGLMRECPTCNTQHFPRTDPVVIMLVYRGNRCVMGQTLGRQSSGFYSCLAGFMDNGESIEEGVRREVMEEGLQTLDEVLRKQLVDAESQYFGQLEGVFKSYVTDFQDTLKSERDKLLEEHSGLTDLLNYYTTSSVEGAQDWNIGTVKSEITSTANQTWQDIWTDFVNAGGSVELQNWFDSQYNANPSWSPSLAQIVAWMSNWLDSGYGDG